MPPAQEGSKSLGILFNWGALPGPPQSGNPQVPINLLQQYQTGQFTTIQAVWIDNTQNVRSVSLKAMETGQVITCPARCFGMFPVFTSVAPVFQLTLNLSITPFNPPLTGLATQLLFLNAPQRYFVSQPVSQVATLVSSATFNLNVNGNTALVGALVDGTIQGLEVCIGNTGAAGSCLLQVSDAQPQVAWGAFVVVPGTSSLVIPVASMNNLPFHGGLAIAVSGTSFAGGFGVINTYYTQS